MGAGLLAPGLPAGEVRRGRLAVPPHLTHRKRGRLRGPPPHPPAPGVLAGVSKEEAPFPQAPPPPPQAPPPLPPGPYSIARLAPDLTMSLAKAAEIVQVLAGVCWEGWRWGAVLGKGMERNKAFLLLRDSLFCGRLVENIVRAPGSERKEGRQLGRENITCRQLRPGRKRCGVEGWGVGGAPTALCRPSEQQQQPPSQDQRWL